MDWSTIGQDFTKYHQYTSKLQLPQILCRKKVAILVPGTLEVSVEAVEQYIIHCNALV